MKNRFQGIVIAVAPTVAYVLHDLVFQLPDNQGDVTPGFLLTLLGLLVVWCWGGYAIARRASGRFASIGWGAYAGVVSVGLLWLTFIVLNQLFIDRMSYEPDRILAFRRSGYATMREFWNHQRGWGPFPLMMAVAMLAGAIGGALRTPKN
ncbi:MAG TPA: hypothetical protein VF219_13335, partial [Vicinamibacterales bacterium]